MVQRLPPAVQRVAGDGLRQLGEGVPGDQLGRHVERAAALGARLELGATEVVAPGEVLRRVRRTTGAFQVKPEFGSPYLLGGVDVAVDAVGNKQSLETALHATRAGGRVVLSGMPAGADLSAAWFRELEVVGSYASAQREPGAEA